MANKTTPKLKRPMRAAIREDDVIELAAHILGKEHNDEFEDKVDELMYDEFGCDLIQFTEIVGRLLPLVGQFKSPLSNKWYKAFSVVEKDGSALALVKIELDPKYQQNYC